MVIAIVVHVIAVVPEAQRQRSHFERTMDDPWFGFVQRKVRQIHVPEHPWRPRLRKEFYLHLSHPSSCSVPVDFHATLAIVRERDAWPAVQGSLANGSDGAGMV